MAHIELQDVTEAAKAVSAAIVAGSIAVSAVLHLLKLDQKPWAQSILTASNDIVGLVKKLCSSDPAPEQPK